MDWFILKLIPLVLLLILPSSYGQRADIDIPEDDTAQLGCKFDQIHLRIVCNSTSVDRVIRSLRYLVHSINDPVQPIQMEIVNTTMIKLPYIFPRFNRTLKIIKVKHTTLRFIYPDAFIYMGRSLVHLDLSWNRLVALPFALRNLTSLEYLDLSHNQIFIFDGNSVFRSPVNLLTLDLSYNAIGLAGVRPEDYKSLHVNNLMERYGVRSRITEKHFSLGDAVNTVQYLDISDTNLVRIPDLFLQKQLPYLAVLKLANNSIKLYPDVLKRLLPKLKKLHIEANQISWLPSYALQKNLEYLDYSDNPLQCACDTLRLREFVELQNIIANLPKCTGPDYVKGLVVRNLPEALCMVTTRTPTRTTTTTTVAPTTTTEKQTTWTTHESATYMSASTKLTNVSADYDRITLTWDVVYKQVEPSERVLRGGQKIIWYAQYRQFSTNNKTTLKISTEVPYGPGNQTYEYVITDLSPVTGYIICFKRTQMELLSPETSSTTMFPQLLCQEITTAGEQIFPVVEVAVATTVSTSTTMAIVAFCCFCCPKSLCKRKKKRKGTKRSVGSSDSEPTQSSQKLYDASETEPETSRSNLGRLYPSTDLEDGGQVQYIDPNNLLITQSSPDLTTTKLEDKTVGDPYLEPIKPILPGDPKKIHPFDVNFTPFRMESYKCNMNAYSDARRQQYRKQSANATDTSSESESDDSGKHRQNRWRTGTFLNYTYNKPMSADNLVYDRIQEIKQDDLAKLFSKQHSLKVMGLIGADILQYFDKFHVTPCLRGKALQLHNGLIPFGSVTLFLNAEVLRPDLKLRYNLGDPKTSTVKKAVNFVLAPPSSHFSPLTVVMPLVM
ncbi:Chondroadherin [Nymphon striatum]|nr:Chondroadherin [Nymphon striatum]